MREWVQGSLFWRFLLFLGNCWQGSVPHRMAAGLRAMVRHSNTHRIVGRCLSAPARQTSNARASASLRGWNERLWKLGRRAVPAVESSLLCRAVRAVFRCGSESRLLGRLFQGGVCGVLLTMLALYGLVDYVLRDVLSIPVVSSLWDEALLLLALLWLVWDRMRAPRPRPIRANPLDPAVFLFVGVALALMFVISPFFSIAVAGWRATVQYMLWFFVVIRLLRDDRDLMNLYYVMVGAAFLIALHGIYQYIVAVPIPSHWTDQAEQSVRTRVFSIFGSPNIMGDFMVMFAPMAASLAYRAKGVKAKLFFWFVTFCMCFACLFTMSRGAWMAMAVAVLVFSALVDRRLLLLILAAGLCSLSLPFVASRIGYLLTPEFIASTTNGGRASRWALALIYWSESPLFGVGLGMFGGAVAMQHKIYSAISYFYVDNYYLKILVEMGVVGLAAFLLLLACLLFTGARTLYRTARVQRDRPAYLLGAGLFSGICGVVVHCYFENIFEEPYMMAYFWIIAAMLVYLGFFHKKEQE